MALEKLEIRVNGQDYTCLKPYPITLMQIEANCTRNDGTLDYDKWTDEILKLISKDIKKEDLVKYNQANVKLENGTELIPSEIPYKQYVQDFNKLKNGLKDIRGIMNTYLKYCGIDKYDLDTLSYDDLWAIMDAYNKMFDETELNKVIESISTFR